MTRPAIRITAILGALILLITAAFHMTAMPQLKAALGGLEAGFFQNGLPAMWILPAVHWVLLRFYPLDYRVINLMLARRF